MELVADKNIIIAALVRDSATRKLLKHPSLHAYLPEYAQEEVEGHFGSIVKKSGLSPASLRQLLSLVLEDVTIVPKALFGQKLDEASPMISDKDDVPFLALALYLKLPIWSNDGGFMEQVGVKVFTTSELLTLLE